MNLKRLINFTFCIVAVGILFSLNACKDNSTNPNTNSDTKIVSFNFESFTPVIVGVIDQSKKTISLLVPLMTNKESITPTIVIPDGATISPESGVPQNFNVPVIYTVTAKDGTKAVYTVTVTEDHTSVNPIVLSGTYSNNLSLPNIRDGVDYIINDRVYISGSSLLTVEPGVTIEFTSTAGAITVEENAGLQMLGTATSPITLVGPSGNPNKASWGGIALHSNRLDNVWKYVYIYNGGGANEDDAALYLGDYASLSMENCLIDGAGYYGIYLDDNTKLTKFDNNVISNCNNAPIYFTYFGQAEPLSLNSTLSGNAKKYVEIENPTTIGSDLTMKELDVAYLCETVYVDHAILTIQPGVKLIFQYDGIFRADEASRIDATGTAAKPIIFTTLNNYPGQWKGIEINSTMNNNFAYVTIENGGESDSQNLYFWNAKANLSNVTIKNSSNWGVNYNSGSTITHSAVTFENNTNGNVYYYDDGTVSTTLP
jgi:hypothetical protein